MLRHIKRVVKTLLRTNDLLVENQAKMNEIQNAINGIRGLLNEVKYDTQTLLRRLEILRHELVEKRPFEGERLVSPVLEYLNRDHTDRYELAKTYLSEEDFVLDIACGIGYGSYILAKGSKREIDGVDLSEEAISYGERYYKLPNVHFQVSDIFDFTSKQKYDAIVSFETIEHVKEGEKVLEIFSRFLKSGGTLIMSTPDEDYLPLEKNPNPFHLRQYTFKEMKAMLETAGFEIQEFYSHDWVYKGMKKNELGGNYVVYVCKKKG